jgi:hypothetical protein
MKQHIEKRACRRNNYRASITCTYFNSDKLELSQKLFSPHLFEVALKE